MAWHRVEKVEDVVEVGQEVTVTVEEVDSQGRINLSMRDPAEKPEGFQERQESRGGRDGGSRGGRGGRDNRRTSGGRYGGRSGRDRERNNGYDSRRERRDYDNERSVDLPDDANFHEF